MTSKSLVSGGLVWKCVWVSSLPSWGTMSSINDSAGSEGFLHSPKWSPSDLSIIQIQYYHRCHSSVASYCPQNKVQILNSLISSEFYLILPLLILDSWLQIDHFFWFFACTISSLSWDLCTWHSILLELSSWASDLFARLILIHPLDSSFVIVSSTQ